MTTAVNEHVLLKHVVCERSQDLTQHKMVMLDSAAWWWQWYERPALSATTAALMIDSAHLWSTINTYLAEMRGGLHESTILYDLSTDLKHCSFQSLVDMEVFWFWYTNFLAKETMMLLSVLANIFNVYFIFIIIFSTGKYLSILAHLILIKLQMVTILFYHLIVKLKIVRQGG